jgi:hypothetical protein
MKRFPNPALVLGLIATAWAAVAPAAGPPEVRSVLERFAAFRPAERDLAIFRLDWEPTLAAARARAAREHRPIFLVVVRNSYGDLISGHC